METAVEEENHSGTSHEFGRNDGLNFLEEGEASMSSVSRLTRLCNGGTELGADILFDTPNSYNGKDLISS
jgi:hypothetical protein